MVPRCGAGGGAPERRFFLARSPDEGEPELASGEIEHARRVLRLATGDHLIGLDGRGAAWPLMVKSCTRRGLSLEGIGDPDREPRPGDLGSRLPWIEVAVALPRGGRAEAMIDRLTQLGISALTPLVSDRATAAARESSASRLERFRRVAVEACKQSGRLWQPKIQPPEKVAVLVQRAAAGLVLLDPTSQETLAEWVRTQVVQGVGWWTVDRPLVVAVGPEGGFAPHEVEELVHRGAVRASLGPYVLRIETAAEAAVAILVGALFRTR